MKQDIILLAAIMYKAQQIYWNIFHIDIVSKITIASLALTIFRTNYYDPIKNPISIPNANVDSFIRRGYYGGHSDVYKPRGENFFYYDVNSLYPYAMKQYPMPIGKAKWATDLYKQNLDELFGFIDACVICPDYIKKPVLPRKDKDDLLIFGTGNFRGVYFSEEFKYAKSIGYDVTPLQGYLFEKGHGLFDKFVTELYDNRLKAKKDGNDGLSYVYKLLMNSLYGRFGINPVSTITEICSKVRYEQMLRQKGSFMFAEALGDEYFICSYCSDTLKSSDYVVPRIAAVHISAAISAYARIYMHPYINRDDSYYKDTDSVVLGSPLPEDVISKDELGKFQLVYKKVIEGIFLAAKSYYLTVEREDGQIVDVVTHKGAQKVYVNKEWFQEQYINPSMTKMVVIRNNFRRDIKSLTINKLEYESILAMPSSNKREKVYDMDGVWVDTKSVQISTLSKEELVLINAYLYKIQIVVQNKEQERTEQDANDNQNGSNEKQNTDTEIGKKTLKNKQDQKVYNQKKKVSKRVRRTKPPGKVSKRRTKPPD